jgi:hypothetical protein
LRKAVIIFLLTLNISCRVERISFKQDEGYDKRKIEFIIQNTERNNITNNDFFIERGEISIKNKEETKRYIFSVKHKNPDKYLISVRNSLGLEGARIFLSEDTVLINDRINKRLLYGTANSIENLLGLPSSFLKMAFGDIYILNNSSKKEINQNNNKIVVSQYVSGLISKSIINSRICKVSSGEFEKNAGKGTIFFKYSKFDRNGSHFPAVIEIKNEKVSEIVLIRIRKLKIPWAGEIEFIPGSGYKKEEIK